MDFIYSKVTCNVPKELPELLKIAPNDDPMEVFRRWFLDALETIPEANAMAVSTCSTAGPSNRMVYLRYWDEDGFVFFTHETSQKGRAISNCPKTELLFYWRETWRQVRIFGEVEVVEEALVDRYFASRSRDSQIGAWASNQSNEIEEAELLEKRFAEFTDRFHGSKVPRPPTWVGYRVVPQRIEFWQGGYARQHERWVFERIVNGEMKNTWRFCRLYP